MLHVRNIATRESAASLGRSPDRQEPARDHRENIIHNPWQPPPRPFADEGWTEEAPQCGDGLDELAALEAAAAAAERAELAAPHCKRQRAGPGGSGSCEGAGAEDSEEDMFGACGLGPAAHAVVEAAGTPGSHGPAAPALRREVPAPGHAPGFVEASLEGIEMRLAAIGERPFFREAGLGRLVHHCTTAAATVSFWPSTLKWAVNGPGGDAVERALAGPAA